MVIASSAAMRGLLHRYFEPIPDIAVTAYATGTEMALKLLVEPDVDLMLIDLDNEDMDHALTGLEALIKTAPAIKSIAMSARLIEDADISRRALTLGASDVLPHPPHRSDRADIAAFHEELEHRIRALTHREMAAMPHPPYPALPPRPTASLAPAESTPPPYTPSAGDPPTRYPATAPAAWAIGSSTGGPEALTTLFSQMKDALPAIPIFITQHLPPTFTSNLAAHIAAASGRACRPGEDGMPVDGQTIYIAPGDYHMTIQNDQGHSTIHLNQDPPENFCRPAVDVMLRSLSAHYGSRLLVTILTGMGHDGLLGARQVREKGGTIIAQDKESSVVWGMPRAVAEANLCNAVLSLSQMPGYLKKAFAVR